MCKKIEQQGGFFFKIKAGVFEIFNTVCIR